MYMKRVRVGTDGFTIVELLIVIVVIGILAAITIVAYNGLQKRAYGAKVSADLGSLSSAIAAARINQGVPLWDLTGGRSGGDGLITADECNRSANGTNFATLPSTHACWVKYNDTLAAISTASGIDVRGLKDPDGRPYFIYEYEKRSANPCDKDQLSVFAKPHVMWGMDWEYARYVPNSLAQC